MNAERALPQPNFGHISQSFGALSEQFALCPNLSAVDGGAGLMRSLETITTQLVLLNRKVDAMDRRIQDLRTEVAAEYVVLWCFLMEHGVLTMRHDRRRNAIARGENATATRASSELVALYSPSTGELIDPFPPTLGQLERLEGRLFSPLMAGACD